MKRNLLLLFVLAATLVCKAQVNPNPDFNHVMIKGQVALITDMSQAMEFVWTAGDIDAETLKKGCFVQILGDYYITDGNNGYFRTGSYNGQYGYNYNWADFSSESVPAGSLAKYGQAYMNTYGLTESNAAVAKTWSNRVVYFRYDPTNRVLYECTLRNYIGHYDWHDFYLKGFVRTLESTTQDGGYDWDKVKNDPLSRYVYNANNQSEYKDSVPLYFSENPYQVDGPCVLMYKGKPWPLKLTNVSEFDAEEAEQKYAQEGDKWLWEYETDPKGDTINLQAGVYIFFLSYYDQKDNQPLTLEAQRVDFGRFDIVGNDTLMPAEPYEYSEDETPVYVNPNPGQVQTGGDVVLSSYYSYQTKQRKYKYKDYVTPYGVSRKQVWYYEYHNHKSSTTTEYPVSGLAEQLGYSGCIAIPYGGFNQNSTHSNHAKLIDGQLEIDVTAQKDQGVPVVIYNRSSRSVTVTYITYDQYQSIKADVSPIIGNSGADVIYDLKGRQIDEADMQRGKIYIRNRKPILFR